MASSLWRVIVAWRWLLLWMAAAVGVDALIPARVALESSRSLTEDAAAWTVSDAMAVRATDQGLRFVGRGEGPHVATRMVSLAAGTEFIDIEACVTESVEAQRASIMLASEAGGALDFNRDYLLNTVFGAQAGQCFHEALPRRAGDGVALLQIQLMGRAPVELELSRLAVTPLHEFAPWRWTRRAMLLAGLALIAWRFAAYATARPRVLALGGLVVVAGILFGCAVSVPLKADIYALLTGGRSVSAPTDLDDLLRVVFPVGGFGIFTGMHALLFGSAMLLLGLLRGPVALLDLALLGAATETLQRFVPGRGPGVSDMVIDWVGLLVAGLLVFLLRRSQRVRLFLKDERIDEDTAGL